MKYSNSAYRAQLKRYFGSALEKSYDELLCDAKRRAALSVKAFENAGAAPNNARRMVLIFIASVLSADGEVSENENRLINDIFGGDIAESVGSMSAMMGSPQYNMMNTAVDAMLFDDKMCFCELALDISAVDGALTDREMAYLVRLFE